MFVQFFWKCARDSYSRFSYDYSWKLFKAPGQVFTYSIHVKHILHIKSPLAIVTQTPVQVRQTGLIRNTLSHVGHRGPAACATVRRKSSRATGEGGRADEKNNGCFQGNWSAYLSVDGSVSRKTTSHRERQTRVVQSIRRRGQKAARLANICYINLAGKTVDPRGARHSSSLLV